MGISILIIKTLSRTENPNAVVFYMGLMMTPVALIPALFVWEIPARDYWLVILAMGPIATLGHVTMVKAYALADASAVVPFDFTRLPFAAVIGWAMFGELADFWTWAGATIIFTSTLYIAHRESAGRHNTAPGGVSD
jgi:drug/metabolite transporter (DMT)-like permease